MTLSYVFAARHRERSVEQQSLKGNIAVVTGGSSGIGATTVRMLAAEGATVYVGYNKGRERAVKLIAELPGSGHEAIHIVLEDFGDHPRGGQDGRRRARACRHRGELGRIHQAGAARRSRGNDR